MKNLSDEERVTILKAIDALQASLMVAHDALLGAKAEMADAVAAEREACAKIAEAEKVDAEDTGAEDDRAYNQACDHIAAAIRARGGVHE